MFRYLLFIFTFHITALPLINKAWGVGDLPSNYYPYTTKFTDVYIGLGYVSTADISTGTGGNPKWGALYNPVKLLGSYGLNFDLGVRPTAKVPFFRNIRIEGEIFYRESRYDILIDSSNNNWINKEKLPPYGKIYLKNVAMLNAYYDFRWLSDIFYPYFGVGFGIGNLGIRHIDFTMLPSFIGEEYVGKKKNVSISQFMAGLQYDTKIIKTSVFFEYRFTNSQSATAYPTYNGNEVKEDKNAKSNDQPKYAPPPPKHIGYKAHSIVFGLKYYLY